MQIRIKKKCLHFVSVKLWRNSFKKNFLLTINNHIIYFSFQILEDFKNKIKYHLIALIELNLILQSYLKEIKIIIN